MEKKLRLFLIFSLILLNLSINSQEVRYLFVNSSPIGATVKIADRSGDLTTPRILKGDDLSSGRIVIDKEGYKPYIISERELRDLVKGDKKIDVTLTPISFDLYFAKKTRYKIGQTMLEGPVYVSKLKSGKYDIFVENDQIKFTKSSVLLPYETAFGTAFGLSLSSTIVTFALAEYFNFMSYNSSTPEDKSFFARNTKDMDIVKFVTLGPTIALGAVLIGLVIADTVGTYQNQKKTYEISDKTPTAEDSAFYQSAINYLSMGELDRSIQILESMESLYKESDLLPLVYYQLGHNYFILGNVEKAIKNWETFIYKYPIYEYYDMALRNLAEIYYDKKDYEMSINLMEKFLFTNNQSFSKETLLSTKSMLYNQIYDSTKNEEYYKKAVENYEFLIDNFDYSERALNYFSELLKLYYMKGDDDKIVKLKLKAANKNIDIK